MKNFNTKKLVLGAVLTGLVILLEFLSATLGKFGMFRFTFALLPIVIGAATCGTAIAALLGFVFGVIVLISGDAAAFLTVNAVGTIITVICKGTLCGLFAALAYKLVYKLTKGNTLISTVTSAIICPVVNTGVFLIFCFIFFMDTITQWAGGTNVGHYMIFVLVGINFIFELATNIILSPIASRLIKERNK